MKIDFYIAGIQKSGTTNLAYLLGKSSNIITHPQMECTFFHDENEHKSGTQYLWDNYFFHTPEYHNDSHYRLIKHSNSFTNIDAFDRVLKHSPDVHFLLIFRNPVHRFISSYLMEKTRSLYLHDLKSAVKKSLEDKQSVEHQIFYSYGQYDKWLPDILNKIKKDNIHFFLFEDLYNDIGHHLEQFAKQFNLTLNTNILRQLPVQNSHREYSFYWYQKMLVYFRRSKLKNKIKKRIAPKHWVKIIKNIEHINLIEPQ